MTPRKKIFNQDKINIKLKEALIEAIKPEKEEKTSQRKGKTAARPSSTNGNFSGKIQINSINMPPPEETNI